MIQLISDCYTPRDEVGLKLQASCLFLSFNLKSANAHMYMCIKTYKLVG